MTTLNELLAATGPRLNLRMHCYQAYVAGVREGQFSSLAGAAAHALLLAGQEPCEVRMREKVWDKAALRSALREAKAKREEEALLRDGE